MRPVLILALGGSLLLPCAAFGQLPDTASLRRQVIEAERSFARTMADRDHGAFAEFLADEAVFFTRDVPIRGKAAVAVEWRPFFDTPDAPFSWEPDLVEVLPSGTLALSSGPVRARDGAVIGRFNSVWRREPDGAWRVVFDRGSPVCAPGSGSMP